MDFRLDQRSSKEKRECIYQKFGLSMIAQISTNGSYILSCFFKNMDTVVPMKNKFKIFKKNPNIVLKAHPSLIMLISWCFQLKLLIKVGIQIPDDIHTFHEIRSKFSERVYYLNEDSGVQMNVNMSRPKQSLCCSMLYLLMIQSHLPQYIPWISEAPHIILVALTSPIDLTA